VALAKGENGMAQRKQRFGKFKGKNKSASIGKLNSQCFRGQLYPADGGNSREGGDPSLYTGLACRTGECPPFEVEAANVGIDIGASGDGGTL
jgi:hypothetical protein